jgi:glycosyltransferase 2 family protein
MGSIMVGHPDARGGRWTHRWILGLVVVACVWVLVGRWTEFEEVARTVADGQWEWVLAAALLQGVFYVLYAALYHCALETVGVMSRVRDLLPLWFVSLFINVAAPTTGAAVFVNDATRRGQSGARAAAGIILVRVADLGSFLIVLLVGLTYLFLRYDLRPYEIGAALILLLVISGWVGVLLLGLSQPDALRRLLVWVQRGVERLARRFKRPPALSTDWAERSVVEYSHAAAITARPRQLLWTLVVALTAHVVDLTSLNALFLAYHHPVRLGVLVAGFAMGVLFWVVTITPEGIGTVEGMMALVYASLGVPASRAAVIALSFRGLTFWLPLLLGFFFVRRVKWGILR